MPLRKSKKADLRSTYGLFVEVSLVAALLLLILAFRTNIQSENGMGFTPPPIEMIPFDEIPITVDILKPPPPPRPGRNACCRCRNFCWALARRHRWPTSGPAWH